MRTASTKTTGCRRETRPGGRRTWDATWETDLAIDHGDILREDPERVGVKVLCPRGPPPNRVALIRGPGMEPLR